jgi:hypothetical protein
MHEMAGAGIVDLGIMKCPAQLHVHMLAAVSLLRIPRTCGMAMHTFGNRSSSTLLGVT